MNNQELINKMKSAYQHMVETIETLIDMEGKTLQEAVEIAEEKLSNWQELTKEEAQKISSEVKSDLQSIGETLNGAKDAYKEQFKIDAAYLTESLWEKLSKAADVGIIEEIIGWLSLWINRGVKIQACLCMNMHDCVRSMPQPPTNVFLKENNSK